MNEKTTGYSLLVFGIGVMLFGTMSVVLVFTKHAEPINLFQISLPAQTTPKAPTPLSGETSLTPDISQVLSQLTSQTGTMFSSSTLTQYSNISAHFFLMTFVVAFGYKIANLGVKLIRPVYVKYHVKENPLEPASEDDSKKVVAPTP